MVTATRQCSRRPGTASRAFVLFVLAAAVLSLIPTGASAYDQSPIFRSQGQTTETPDPENPSNDVVRFTTDATATGFASVTRDLRAKKLQVEDLTNMLSVKYYFVDRTCVGGSPRFQINIDALGDKTHVRNAWGYFGNQSFGGGCPQGTWVHQDLANLDTTAGVWDVSSFFPGAPMTLTWAQLLQFFATNYPDHDVWACGVFDDSGGFASGAVGTVYLDNVQCHDRVLEDHLDVAPGTSIPF
jgi:hypothetical protein